MNDYNDEIIDFLCQEENLRTALEICSRMDDVKLKLHNEFWLSFDNALKTRLGDSPYANRWEIAKNQPPKSTFTTSLYPLSPQSAEIGIGLSEEGRNQNYHLFYTIGFRKTGTRKPEAAALRSKLRKLGFKKSVGPAYIMHKYLDYRTGKDGFLLRVAANPVDLAQEILEGLWIVFEQTSPEILDANMELSKP